MSDLENVVEGIHDYLEYWMDVEPADVIAALREVADNTEEFYRNEGLL